MQDEMEAKRDEYIMALSLCVYCIEVVLEDILPDKEDQIEERCDESECPADPCKIEKPDLPGVDGLSLSQEEKTTLKEEPQRERGEFCDQLTLCVCCAGETLEELLSDRPKGKGHRRPGRFGGKFCGRL